MGFVIEVLVTHVFSYRSSHAGERRAKRVSLLFIKYPLLDQINNTAVKT